MPKTKESKCSRCGGKHTPPTGRKCKQYLSSTVEEEPVISSIQQQTQVPATSIGMNREEHIIQLLTDIKDKQQQFDDRITQLELSSASKSSTERPNLNTQQRMNLEDYTSHGIVPSLEALRASDTVQRQVADRLKGLQQAAAYQGNFNTPSNVGKVIKSGRFRGAEAHVIKNIPWPHELCFVGAARKTVSYDEITPLQFAVGFLKSVQLEQSPEVREAMLDYYIKLAQDGIDVGWNIARGANAVIYSTLEQGRVSWCQTGEMDRLRMLYTQRSTVADTHVKPADKRRVICFNFNNNKCLKDGDHDKDGVTYRHICKYCFNVTRKPFGHAEVNCKRRQREDGREQQ